MQINKQVTVHFQKFSKHFIRQLWCQNLQVGYCSDGISHLKILSIFEQETGWSNIILCIQPGTQHIIIAEPEWHFDILVECFIHDLQTLYTI